MHIVHLHITKNFEVVPVAGQALQTNLVVETVVASILGLRTDRLLGFLVAVKTPTFSDFNSLHFTPPLQVYYTIFSNFNEHLNCG